MLVAAISDRFPEIDPASLRPVGDAAARLLLSHILNPSDDPPEAVASALADTLVRALTRREPV